MRRKQLLEESAVTHSDFPFPPYSFLEIEKSLDGVCIVHDDNDSALQIMFSVVDHDGWSVSSVSLEISVCIVVFDENDMA